MRGRCFKCKEYETGIEVKDTKRKAFERKSSLMLHQ